MSEASLSYAYGNFNPAVFQNSPSRERFLERHRRKPQEAVLNEMPRLYSEEFGIPIGPAHLLKGNYGNRLVLFDNTHRAEKYRQRAKQAENRPPDTNGRSLFSFPDAEYQCYIPGYDMTASINVAPYTPTSTIFIPGPVQTPGGHFERSQHPGSISKKDLKFLDKASQKGMLLWWVGDVPTNNNLHFHGLADRIRGVRYPISWAIKTGGFNMQENRLQIANSEEGPVEYNSFLTRSSAVAHAALQEVAQTDVRVNMIVTEGTYVITPVGRYKACFLNDPENPCYWLPSSERAGFFLKQQDMQLTPNTVTFGQNTMTHDEFMLGYYRELADLGMSAEDVRNLFPPSLHALAN